MSYRPITDTWLLARSKVKYYGAYPAGFLHRARELLGVNILDPVLHVCSGMVRQYPFRGLGPNDRTLDIDPETQPDILRDARTIDAISGPWRASPEGQAPVPWPAILADRPYTEADAAHYRCGADVLPDVNDLLRRSLEIVRPGGRVGILDYIVPRPPRKTVRLVAMVGVIVGFNNRIRAYTVFEKEL